MQPYYFFKRKIELNITELFLPTSKMFCLSAGWGRIVNIGSVHSIIGSPNKSAYTAAKHGIAGLTKVSVVVLFLGLKVISEILFLFMRKPFSMVKELSTRYIDRHISFGRRMVAPKLADV